MQLNRSISVRAVAILALIASLTILSNKIQADTGTCGGVTITLPFNDVMASPFFCQIAAAYFSGLTNGTTATTYSPTDTVTREQMAAFITRTQDSALRRGSSRASLNQWWTTTPHFDLDLGTTTVGMQPAYVQSDGADIWVSGETGTLTRVRASDGKVLNTFTNIAGSYFPLVAMGRVFIVGRTTPGILYMIDPNQVGTTGQVVTNSLGSSPVALAFDGDKIWSANFIGGSVSIVTPGASFPWAVTTVPGFTSARGILFDGSNIWVVRSPGSGAGSLVKLDSAGSVLQTVTVENLPVQPLFDGTNIWVPNGGSNSITIVRASSGAVIATLTGNGLDVPSSLAFDGQRILATNSNGNSVSIWKAADLTPLGTFATGASTRPFGVCSDGLNFWITLSNQNKLARF